MTKDLIQVSGSGENADRLVALGDALNATLGAIIAAGCGPQHLQSMCWRVDYPAVLHPSRRAVDRVWREVFAGFRPPLTLEKNAAPHCVEVRAMLAPPDAPPSPEPVYHGYSIAELARQMSPRGQVADMLGLFRKWTREGEAARLDYPALDLRYGPHRENILDLYKPSGVENPPVWVFIHGGYWQASSKDQHAQYCKGMLDAGFAVANIDYPLAPETPLIEIVSHVREALRFIVREQYALAVDATRMHIAGHSAGGHLAAMMAADPHAPPIASALLLSGIFNVEALRPIPMGKVLGLASPETCARLSPLSMMPRKGIRFGVALGAMESDEFKRQSREIAKRWHADEPLHLAGAHHFSLLDGLNSGALLSLAKAVASA